MRLSRDTVVAVAVAVVMDVFLTLFDGAAHRDVRKELSSSTC
jgi:hypothetical protein